MALAVFSDNLRVLNAENFKRSISNDGGYTKLYFTFGRGYAWANDAAPQQANSSVVVFNDVWDNMIGAKLLTGYEISHVIPRNDWESGTVYTAYDHCSCTHELFETKFYVVTDDWNVYKCLSNNGGEPSTVKPTQIYTNRSIRETDGYVWKYMYTISDSEKIKFVTDKHIPVKTLTTDDNSLQWKVQKQATPGALEAIEILNAGEGYPGYDSIIITITGDGSGAKMVAKTNSTGSVANVSITAIGAGYTYANATIESTGSNAAFRLIIDPPSGHGSDPLRELGGYNLMLNPRLVSTEDSKKFPVTNDFRQVALIQDPISKVTGKPAANVTYSQYYTIYLNNDDTVYQQDEVVFQGASLATSSFRGRVLSYDSSGNVLRITNASGLLQFEPIIGSVTGTARIPSGRNSVVTSELQPYTGELIYIDNITPITRAEDQTEDFKILLKF